MEYSDMGMIDSFKEYMVARENRKALEITRNDELDKKRHEITLKELDLEMKFVEQGKMKPEDNLDFAAMKQMESSYKDEIIMFILFTPIGLVFVPTIQPYIEAGFKILNSTVPEWYVYLVSGIVVTIYGLRSLVRLVFSGKSKGNKESKEIKTLG